MEGKIKVAAVSYLNTKPLLYGLRKSTIFNNIELVLDYPANLATLMQQHKIDIALLPIAAIPLIPDARVFSDYGIASNGNVASVALFSQVPINEIKTVYLDYQSKTSVKLAQLLFKKYWKKEVGFIPADEDYISKIKNTTGGIIIGDRALMNINNFQYIYDLSTAWKNFSGFDFVFATWVTNKDLSIDFITEFNKANAFGLQNIAEVIKENNISYYDLNTYYTKNIQYFLDEPKLKGMQLFLDLISKDTYIS